MVSVRHVGLMIRVKTGVDKITTRMFVRVMERKNTTATYKEIQAKRKVFMGQKG